MIFNYLYDFLSIMFDKAKEREAINQVILFGSFAAGNPRNDSDIDLFIDVKQKDKESVRSIVRESLNEFELKASKTWHLKGINNAIVPIIDTLSDKRWDGLRADIAEKGIVLFGSARISSGQEKQRALITYTLSKKSQNEKMKIIRAISGYKLKKGKKTYVNQGIQQIANAEKINNALLVNSEQQEIILSLLKKYKIPYKKRIIWEKQV